MGCLSWVLWRKDTKRYWECIIAGFQEIIRRKISFVWQWQNYFCVDSLGLIFLVPGINLWMHPANKKWCYILTSSLIGWAHTQNNPFSTGVNIAICNHHFKHGADRSGLTRTRKWVYNCPYNMISEIHLNTLKQRQNGWHLADDIFKSIFIDENLSSPHTL